MLKLRKIRRLRTPRQISEVNEDLYSDMRAGLVDNQTANALNATIRNQIYLNVRLRMDYLKLLVQAQSKKITLPRNILPPMEK